MSAETDVAPLKTCKCGSFVAPNVKVCPNCGHRFTHPFLKAIAWIIGISLTVRLIVIASNHTPAPSATIPVPVASDTIAIPTPKPTQDEVAFVLKHCGHPERDFREKAPGTLIRHLVYKRFDTELFFYRDANTPLWVLGNAFIADRDELMTFDEANRRMPCARGQLHSFLDAQ